MYVSLSELVEGIIRLYPEKYDQKRVKVLEEVLLCIHGLETYETDERGQLRKRIPPKAIQIE